MQSAKGKPQKPVALVKKPILKGSWHGKDAWKLALKRLLSMVAVTVIYLIGGMLLSLKACGAVCWPPSPSLGSPSTINTTRA